MPRPQQNRRSRKRIDREDTIHHSIRLMECFETPPKRTIFGSKNSEHWDSFQSKYSSSFDSNHNFEDRDHHYRTLRNQHKPQTTWNRDDAVQPTCIRKRAQGRNKNWIVWLLLGCKKSAPKMRCERSHESDFQRRHRDRRRDKITEIHTSIPLVQRYSDYFERRRLR